MSIFERAAFLVVSGDLLTQLDYSYGHSEPDKFGRAIGVVWNESSTHKIEYKLMFVWDEDLAPESLKSLETDIKTMISSVHWTSNRINWRIMYMGMSLITVALSVAFVMVVHSCCCQRKKKESGEDKKPMLAFKV